MEILFGLLIYFATIIWVGIEASREGEKDGYASGWKAAVKACAKQEANVAPKKWWLTAKKKDAARRLVGLGE